MQSLQLNLQPSITTVAPSTLLPMMMLQLLAIDLVLRYPTHGAGEFTLAASNLLDEQYITYFSQTVSFVSDRDFVSGRGRALTLRWKGEF